MNRTVMFLLAAALTVCPALAGDALQPGLIGRYYQMGGSLQDFPTLPAGQKPDVERVDKDINFASTLAAFPGTKLVDNFYVNWTGVIRIPKDGNYTFYLESDDGSRLFIDGKQVVDHSGLHDMTEMSGRAELKAGDHELKVEFFDAEEEAGCILSWEPAGQTKELVPAAVLFHASSSSAPAKTPPGFTALFNGQDLAGWRGGDTFDHRKLLALPAEQRAAQIAKWTETMKAHWTVENDELVNDGKGAYATTEKDYGDFELLLEYKTVAKADSGIYLRGCPQVQIWDSMEKEKFPLGADKGSGGLWNNSPGAPGKDPLVLADKPFGEWNTVRVIMVGARVTVWLNEKLVVDNALLENYYDRKTPVPSKGPVQLQTHGGEIRWRNLCLREIGAEEANQMLWHAKPGSGLRTGREISAEEKGQALAQDGFKSVFNGRDFTGWAGPTNEYQVVDGAIQCRPGKGGTIYTTDEYSDFIVRLEIKLPHGGNNGLAIRYPGHGVTAYDGMCEIQVLDDNYEQATGEKIDPRQAHGSAYGMVAAARGYQRPIGEWNYEEVTIKGSTIKVELNGTMILDTDLSKVDMANVMDHSAHPGKDRTSGSFGFAGHNDPVAFRNILIKKL